MYTVFDHRTNKTIFQSNNYKECYHWAIDFATKRAFSDITASPNPNDYTDYDPHQEPDFELLEGANIEIITNED